MLRWGPKLSGPTVPGMLTLTRHRDVTAVLSDRAFVVPPAEPPGPVGTLAWLRATVSRFCEGPAHARRRAIVVERLAALDLDELRARARDGTVASTLVPVEVLALALGVPAARAAEAVANVVALAGPYRTGEQEDDAADRAVARLLELLPAAEPEVAAQHVAILVQACDATAGLISAALRRPPGASLAEVLRLDAPVRVTRRRAAGPVRVGEHRVAAGDVVVLDLAAANRDPSVFPDAERFDPARAGEAHVAFGAGPRACPAARQALALASGALEALR
jgi:cytochrome P450